MSSKDGKDNLAFSQEESVLNQEKKDGEKSDNGEEKAEIRSRKSSKNMVRKMTTESRIADKHQRREICLKNLRECARSVTKGNSITQIDTLLRDQEFSSHLYDLFDVDGDAVLTQNEWLELIRTNISTGKRFSHLSADGKREIVEILETITYMVCQDNDVTQEDFHKILTSRNVPIKLFRAADQNGDGDLSIDEVMNFLVVLTKPTDTMDLTEEQVQNLEDVFRQNLPPDQNTLTLKEFKKFMPSKNTFFVERAFKIFDSDGSGDISLAEFIDTMYQFAGRGQAEKILFLFKVYDIDGDGMIQEEELEEVLRACLQESGMTLPDSDVQALAWALIDEALDANEEDEYTDEINIDQLRNVLVKHEGLVENLTISLAKWLVPQKKVEKKGGKIGEKVKTMWETEKKKIRAEWQMYLFIAFIFGVNIILFVTRAYYFRDMYMLNPDFKNIFYMLSRANGRCLNFSSMMVIILVLRYTISRARDLGLSKILPLDHNIYLHKVTGCIIFVCAWTHAIMHVCNFSINVQPNPVQFVQMNTEYWVVPIQNTDPLHHEGKAVPKWHLLGYKLPPGCVLIDLKHAKMSNRTRNLCQTELELEAQLNITYNDGRGPVSKMTVCEIDLNKSHKNVTEICTMEALNNGEDGNQAKNRERNECEIALEKAEPCQRWSIFDWLFTPNHGVFGLTKGFANITGVALITILTIMVLCSLPIVRKSGYFQVFYFTHLLFIAYMALLIIHAPDFWKWLLIPGLIYVVERLYRTIATTVGHGKSTIVEGNVLASRVTELVIKKPDTFKYSAGDWVFVRVPEIAQFEWHPFTISSAPERKDAFTLHIRGVGNWTNRLYNYFEEVKSKMGRQSRSASVMTRRMTRGKSLKFSNTKHDEEQNKTSFLTDLNNRMDKLGQTNNKSVRIHDGQEGMDVIIDNNKNGPGLVNEAFEMNSKDQNKFESFHSQISRASASSTPRYGSTAPTDEKKLEIYIDGPFGAPASNIFRAEHAVLIATGIGVTPFSSILRSIMHRYQDIKRECPRCNLKWNDNMAASSSTQSLKKVDFFWINRDQKSFEWFIKLLTHMEEEQTADDHGGNKFLDVHMYITAALQRTDMRAVALQTAIDILHKKENRDVMTGLKTKTHAGRPNWEKAFQKIRDENHGVVTVFYCGNPHLAKILRRKCENYGFNFRKEVF